MASGDPHGRSDSVSEKIRLLQDACASGNRDLAMSLAASLRDTLMLERDVEQDLGPPHVGADQFSPVEDLPQAWRRWARGWSFCKPLALFETVGIARSGEPVHAVLAFPAEETTDLPREVRLARVEPHDGMLHEVPCQIMAEARRGRERHVQLVFLADVPAHGRASYLVLYGNPWAELPRYATDLRVSGEGYGLDIENHYYRARMSRQMGQLERLVSKREHGLELYAGGKGHGEPPTADWGHDYVDPGHFQKLRMRNWAQCPNHEVVRGPLCVRVRRWGFPHSPLHPLFAPARLHMDQAYVFYAGLPYFFKEGRFDAVKEFEFEAMRDDEWVFSGYSFTDILWIDSRGKLHEGPAPAADLWGVGFFHRDSRDAFLALRLEHTADKLDRLEQGGPPTLHYDGHGQLWSRYPARQSRLPAGAAIRQRNAYFFGLYPGKEGAEQVERLRHQLLNPLEVRAEPPPAGTAKASAGLARPGETAETAPEKPPIWNALREVRDDQLYQIDGNIVDLGYVYDVRVRAGVAQVVVTMPHRGRPEPGTGEPEGDGVRTVGRDDCAPVREA